MVALVVMLFPPLLIAFLLVMERVEEPLRRPPTSREVEEFLGTARPARWTRSPSPASAARSGAGGDAAGVATRTRRSSEPRRIVSTSRRTCVTSPLLRGGRPAHRSGDRGTAP